MKLKRVGRSWLWKIVLKRIPPNLWRDIVLKEVKRNCPLLKYGLCRETSFRRVQYGKGVGGNFTMERPDSYDLI